MKCKLVKEKLGGRFLLQPKYLDRKTEIFLLSPHERLPQALLNYWRALANTGLTSVCNSLHEFGITYFLYVKRFRDGSQIELTNNIPWSEYYYSQAYYALGSFENIRKHYDRGTFLWSGLPCQEIYKNLRECFQIDHGVTLVLKNSDGNEFFHFAGERSQYQLINFYFNQQCVLKRFILYFKDKMSGIIKAAEKKRLLLPMGFCRFSDQKSACFENGFFDLSKKMPINRYYLEGEFSDLYITHREAECLKWHVHGKTAYEISVILNISKRTAEAHLDNIKLKLNCVKQSQLGSKFGWLIDLL